MEQNPTVPDAIQTQDKKMVSAPESLQSIIQETTAGYREKDREVKEMMRLYFSAW